MAMPMMMRPSGQLLSILPKRLIPSTSKKMTSAMRMTHNPNMDRGCKSSFSFAMMNRPGLRMLFGLGLGGLGLGGRGHGLTLGVGAVGAWPVGEGEGLRFRIEGEEIQRLTDEQGYGLTQVAQVAVVLAG